MDYFNEIEEEMDRRVFNNISKMDVKMVLKELGWRVHSLSQGESGHFLVEGVSYKTDGEVVEFTITFGDTVSVEQVN